MRAVRQGRRGFVPALTIVMIAAFGAGTATAELSPDLEARLADTPAGGLVPVIATLHRQVDGERYEDRPTALLRALRRTAATTQDDVADEVAGPVRGFWLVNALAFRGTPDEIRAVADDPAVDMVDVDRPVQVQDRPPVGIQANPYPDAGEGNWGLTAIGAQRAWSRFGVRGAGVRVGNIDTGVDAGSPALAGRVAAWRDFVSGRPAPYDDNGHGTHTAGTIAGGGSAAIGVAPDSQLIVAKAMAADGAGSGSSLLAAAEWMTDPDGNPATADQPQVINNSWSSSAANDTWFRPMITRWRELGIVPVFSAGNTGPRERTVGSPASYPEVLAVGAVDRDGTVAPFSARGPVVWADLDGLGPTAGTVLTKPDLVGPGVGITSSVGSGYLSYSGTSMAAPHVAGAAALVRQAAPGLSADAVVDILRRSADDIDAPGPDIAAGHGRVNVVRALEIATGTSAGEPTAAGAASIAFVEVPPAVTARRAVRYRVALRGDAALVRTRVDGGTWSGATSATTFTLTLPQGTHTVEAQGLSESGTGGEPASHRVTIDGTGPRISVSTRLRGSAMVFTARATDPAGVRTGSITWSFGDGDIARGAQVRRAFADRVPRRVTVRVSDALGNRGYRAITVRPSAAAPVRALQVRTRVPDGTARLAVRGSLRRPARLTATLRPIATPAADPGGLAARFETARTGRQIASASTTARRRFALSLPLRSAGPGRYRLAVVVRSGGVTAVTTRTITIRR